MVRIAELLLGLSAVADLFAGFHAAFMGIAATGREVSIDVIDIVRIADGQLLPLAGWVADGLLAVFFFVAGLEVKRELTAGITVAALPDALTDPIAQGVFAGLLVGRTAGIFGGTWLAVRLALGRLPDGVGWADVLPVAVLGGIGCTVSLLVTELAFTDPDTRARAAGAVLAASLLASVVAMVLLRRRRA